MAIEPRLLQKLSQSLLMTPQLQQALKLLQLGRLEYLEAIQKELLENPVLEELKDETEQSQPPLQAENAPDPTVVNGPLENPAAPAEAEPPLLDARTKSDASMEEYLE